MLPGKAGKPLAERGHVCLRASALDLGAQRLGERRGGAELTQRLHVGVYAFVRGCRQVDQFLRYLALGAQIGERPLQLAQLARSERS